MNIKLLPQSQDIVYLQQILPGQKFLAYIDFEDGELCILPEEQVILISDDPNELGPLLEKHGLKEQYDVCIKQYPDSVFIIYKNIWSKTIGLAQPVSWHIFEAPKEVAL